MLEKRTKQPPGTSGESMTPQPSSPSNQRTVPGMRSLCLVISTNLGDPLNMPPYAGTVGQFGAFGLGQAPCGADGLIRSPYGCHQMSPIELPILVIGEATHPLDHVTVSTYRWQ